VPYRSQEDQDAWRFRNDCGPACAAMILEWQGMYFTVNYLSTLTSLITNDNGLTCYQLSTLINKTGGKSSVKVYNNEQMIIDRLDLGFPVIALINYRYIPNKQSSYNGGHFVVIRGYDQDSYYINDPDWWGSRRNEGNNFKVPKAALWDAIRLSPAPKQVVEIQG
jgi:ABC-type bacteriocin/lantibiotic exporter with double-glycine peptidase domain